MRERTGQLLRTLCLVLGALLVYQLVQISRRANPLARVSIPALPVLDSDTNAASETPASTPAQPATHEMAGRNGNAATNLARTAGTNSTPTPSRAGTGTNTVAEIPPASNGKTNAAVAVDQATHSPQAVAAAAPDLNGPNAPTASATNGPSAESQNTAGSETPDSGTSSTETNAGTSSGPDTVASASRGTNVAPSGTNSSLTLSDRGTNLHAASTSASGSLGKSHSTGTNAAVPPNRMMAAMNRDPGGGMGGRGPAPELAPDIKARVERIYESELFGQIMHPMPMGLLGIAGNSAFLRAANGQTGVVKEGDSLGDLKLLRIGINRVLVEQDGKQSELMIFNGLGGQSLMPADKEPAK